MATTEVSPQSWNLEGHGEAGGSGKRSGCSSRSSVGQNSWISGILGLKDKKGSH